MSAVESRLAAIIAEHEWCPRSTAWYEPYGACGCGHNTAQDGDWKPYDVGCWATHVAAVIASANDLAVIAKPDAKNPTPALIEAAYIAQDDLSKPPEPWLIESTAEIIDAYVDAQGHDTVHVIGHDAALLAAAKAAEGVSDRG